jgi:threonine dehydratase
MSAMKVALSLENIREASQSIDPVFLRSPQFVSAGLSDRLGRETVIKIETFNPIKSFKGRGADYFMRQIPSGRTVACASAGNFGQAIAYAGSARGVSVRVFAATTANTAKVARMRELGAQVVLEGPDFDAAKSAARDYVRLHPECLFVEDGHDARISEGAGTVAVELDRMPMDVLLVPVGNGALISGIGRWMKARNPQTKIIGICAQAAPAMALSWREGRPVSSQTTATMADGLAVRVPVPAAVDWMGEYVDDMVLVSEESIWRALEVVRDTVGLLVEPSGAAGIAAALEYGRHGSPLGTIITGGNLSAELLASLTGDAPAR